jgi:hypothetical protein
LTYILRAYRVSVNQSYDLKLKCFKGERDIEKESGLKRSTCRIKLFSSLTYRKSSDVEPLFLESLFSTSFSACLKFLASIAEMMGTSRRSLGSGRKLSIVTPATIPGKILQMKLHTTTNSPNVNIDALSQMYISSYI